MLPSDFFRCRVALTSVRTGPGIGESDVITIVHALHDSGFVEITAGMVLEAWSPHHQEAASAVDLDLVFPAVCNILKKAGQDGVLQVVHDGVAVKVVFGQ